MKSPLLGNQVGDLSTPQLGDRVATAPGVIISLEGRLMTFAAGLLLGTNW